MKPMSEVFELPVNVSGSEIGDANRWVAYFDDGENELPYQAQHAAHAINSHDLMREALQDVHELIIEATKTGFNCNDGDWAERLFASQGKTFKALKQARGE